MPVYSSLKGICDSTRQVLSVSYGFSPVQGRSTIHLTKFSLCPTGLVLSTKKKKNINFGTHSSVCTLRVYSSLRRIYDSKLQVLSTSYGFTPLWEKKICDSARAVLSISEGFILLLWESVIRHVKFSLHPPCLLLSEKNARFDTASPLCILRVYSSPRRK